MAQGQQGGPSYIAYGSLACSLTSLRGMLSHHHLISPSNFPLLN